MALRKLVWVIFVSFVAACGTLDSFLLVLTAPTGAKATTSLCQLEKIRVPDKINDRAWYTTTRRSYAKRHPFSLRVPEPRTKRCVNRSVRVPGTWTGTPGSDPVSTIATCGSRKRSLSTAIGVSSPISCSKERTYSMTPASVGKVPGRRPLPGERSFQRDW